MDRIVVKIGGGAELGPAGLWQDVATLVGAGVECVVVHGGNAALTALQERLGAPARFVENSRGEVSRYTDSEAIDHFAMVYAGQLNVRHVCGLRARGVNALGLTGVDGGLFVGTRRDTLRCVEDGKKKVLRDDHTGTLDHVNGGLIELLLSQGYTPVVTVPAYAEGPEGAGGVPINIDGDTAAEALAQAIGADALVFLSDVPGLLRDVQDPTSLYARIDTPAAWRNAEAAAGGRMRRKVEAARRATEAGVGTVILADGRSPRPLQAALDGAGTHFAATPLAEVPHA